MQGEPTTVREEGKRGTSRLLNRWTDDLKETGLSAGGSGEHGGGGAMSSSKPSKTGG